jgi:uncharacterized membrane protein
VSKVLIADESWVTHSIHQKGFDSFTTTSYEEGVARVGPDPVIVAGRHGQGRGAAFTSDCSPH